jgi:hypothetical protein
LDGKKCQLKRILEKIVDVWRVRRIFGPNADMKGPEEWLDQNSFWH